MWIFHLIAGAALLFGCGLGWLAYSAGESIWSSVAWPLALTFAAYSVSIVVASTVANLDFRDLPKVVKAMFLPKSWRDDT
jgi:hypothetical protein